MTTNNKQITPLQYRQLGQTDLKISRLGVGLSEIGYELSLAEEAEASGVLNIALDNGLNFLDTSTCYGLSEEWIGRTIAQRRGEYILATKACGHKDDAPWSGQVVTASIELSLRRMKTDYLDLVQLHSCDLSVLQQGEVIEALLAAKRAGKTRYVGYSGDNEAALWAVESGLFDTLQTSFNMVDQQARSRLFPQIQAKGMGLIAKRPIANAAWGASSSPSDYATRYFERAQAMLKLGDLPAIAPTNRIVLALAFTLAHEAVNTAIIGTRSPKNMQRNIEWLQAGLTISPEVVTEFHRRFDELGAAWPQLR